MTANIPPSASTREDRIVDSVLAWPGVSTQTGDFGETEFCIAGRSFGHVHGDWQADIPYPRRIRDQLVAEGRAEPHHIHPDSTWITRYIRSDADAEDVVELLRLNYDRIVARRRTTDDS